MKLKNTLDQETKHIHNAICHFTLFNIKEIEDSFFEKLINFIDLSNINDREFLNNERLKKYVDYEKINKKQLIRLATRDPDILNKINLKKFKFKIKELEYFFKMWPEFVDFFDFDLKKLTGDELIILLDLNIKYASEIDFKSIQFNKYHITELIKNYYHREIVINKLLEIDDIFDNFQIRHLILQTGNKHLSKLKLDKLNELDWYNILTNRPDMFNFCDISIFEKNDCYLLTKLAKYIPQIEYYVLKNKEKITNLGWENLLKLDFEKYYPHCCFDCLNYSTRKKFMHKLEPR